MSHTFHTSRTSTKLLPLVLAIAVALAIAGCKHDDPTASQSAMEGQADTAQTSPAQTSPPQNDPNTPPAPEAAMPAGSTDAQSATAEPMGTTPFVNDQAFVQTALAGGMAEVSVSRYVASKAKSADVRSLAKRIADDHEAMSPKLRALAGPNAGSTTIDDAAKSAESMIRGSQGAALDKAYLDHMADDHRKDIALFEAAAAQATDPAVRKLAEDALPTLREHAKLVDAQLAATK
jgi:putative membrane protein